MSKGMNVEQVIALIMKLAESQGFYSRMLDNIIQMRNYNKEAFQEFKRQIEEQNFKDDIDVIMFFEC